MRKLLFGCVLATLAPAAMAAPAAAPIIANQAAPSPSKAPVQIAADKPQPAVEKKICKSLEVGFSHRTERVCMTAKRWETYNRDDS